MNMKFVGNGGENRTGGSDERVGPGRPPRQSRFKPGQSGNLGGRPKRPLVPHKLLFEELNKAFAIETNDGVKSVPRLRAIIMALIQKTMKGDPRAIRLFNEYGAEVQAHLAMFGREPKEPVKVFRWTEKSENVYQELEAYCKEHGIDTSES